jgi:hypothetical protein
MQRGKNFLKVARLTDNGQSQAFYSTLMKKKEKGRSKLFEIVGKK